MAVPSKYQAKEVLNKVLNAGEDALNVDLSDSVTVTVDSEFPAAAAITDNFANPTTTSAMSMLMGWDTSTWDRVQIGDGTAASALRVTISTNDSHFGAVGVAADADGVIHGQLRYIADSVAEIEGAVETIETAVGTDGSTGPAKSVSVAGTQSGGTLEELRVDSDGHLQVDVLSAASTAVTNGGTFAVQSTLQASDGTDIGDVDVTSVIPGVAATSLGKAIQSAQGGTDTGVAALVVRNDALADLSGADGDYTPLQVNKTGALNVTETTGHLGAIFEDGDTNTTSKQIIAIQFIEDTTFTTLTPVDSSYIGTASGNGDAIDTSNVFPQGMTIFGRWTGYRLASGTVVAYQGSW